MWYSYTCYFHVYLFLNGHRHESTYLPLTLRIPWPYITHFSEFNSSYSFCTWYKKGYIYCLWQNTFITDFISVKEEENENQLCSSVFEVQCNKAKNVLLKWTHSCINLVSHSGSASKVVFSSLVPWYRHLRYTEQQYELYEMSVIAVYAHRLVILNKKKPS